MKRIAMKMVALVLSSVVAGSASAASNFLCPITGAAFKQTGAQVGNANLRLTDGTIYNDGAASVSVEASLGHTAGGTNTFDVIVAGNGGVVTCTVIARPDALGSGSQSFSRYYSASAAVAGGLTYTPFTITANPPSGGSAGSHTFSIRCVLPPIASGISTGILGVKPNQ